MLRFKRIILAVLLVFNIFSMFSYAGESFFNTKTVSERVLIVDKYETGNGGKTGHSHYMKGTNDKGYYKIPGSKYDIGDTVTVYQNPDSANAKGSDVQWYTSALYTRRVSIAGFIFFFILTVINAALLLKSCRNMSEAHKN